MEICWLCEEEIIGVPVYWEGKKVCSDCVIEEK